MSLPWINLRKSEIYLRCLYLIASVEQKYIKKTLYDTALSWIVARYGTPDHSGISSFILLINTGLH